MKSAAALQTRSEKNGRFEKRNLKESSPSENGLGAVNQCDKYQAVTPAEFGNFADSNTTA